MASQPKKLDWHPADVMAALRKTRRSNGRGWTLRALSLANGYSENAVGFTLRGHPWPAVEAIIASTIGVPAPEIWPSRYNTDGTPKRRTAHPLSTRRRRRVCSGQVA